MKHVAYIIMTLSTLVLHANKAVAQPQSDERRPPGRFNPLMRLFDVDQDDTLSADEIASAAARLKAFDTNKDGQLSDEELRGALPLSRGPNGAGQGRRRGTGAGENGRVGVRRGE